MQVQQPINFKRDWNWQEGYLPEVRRILLQNAAFLFTVQIASFQQDVKEATDMVLSVQGQKRIGVRLRRAEYGYRDLTIRASRVSGAQTELSKIQAGLGDAYLYGWTIGLHISEWMLIDLNRLRASGLLTFAPLRHNKDGQTSFIAISYPMLRQYGCVLNANVRAA